MNGKRTISISDELGCPVAQAASICTLICIIDKIKYIQLINCHSNVLRLIVKKSVCRRQYTYMHRDSGTGGANPPPPFGKITYHCHIACLEKLFMSCLVYKISTPIFSFLPLPPIHASVQALIDNIKTGMWCQPIVTQKIQRSYCYHA